MLLHDRIKAMYIKLGYLPDYPYHLISDAEMLEAFIGYVYTEDFKPPEFGIGTDPVTYPEFSEFLGKEFFSGMSYYFYDNYPCSDDVNDEVRRAYEDLYTSIYLHLRFFMNDRNTETAVLPDWVYSYMLGIPISVNSDTRDIHDLLVSLNADNLDDEYTGKAQTACFKESDRWLKKTRDAEMVQLSFTMLGYKVNDFVVPRNKLIYIKDIHGISKEVAAESIVAGDNIYYTKDITINGMPFNDKYSHIEPSRIEKVRFISEYESIPLRPPAMFGEPHVLKSLRLKKFTPVEVPDKKSK